ncbi:MAG: M4 family metallopeptidase [Vicinamibacterales bacterium]|nr:M4 family metallopeptidase [Vicinamibacterales bacterium]
MPGFHKVVLCAAIVAVTLFAGGSRLTGQSAAFPERGRSLGVEGAAATLPAALTRMDGMLRVGELDIASRQEDTMIAGRAHERLKQMYKGVPVFGGQVARQMDGRSIVSVSGRVYEGLDLDVTAQISPQRASTIALAASPSGANVHGDATLGVLPVADNAYRLVYSMDVRSDWDVRRIDVDAKTGELVRSFSTIQTSTTIGQGTGVLGGLRKMSTDSSNSTFRAVDLLRPASANTFDFRGSASRLNAFLATGLLFNSDIATDSDNVWNDGPTVDAHVYQGWVHDYYFKRYGRRGLDDHNLEIDGIVHPLARSQAGVQPPDIVGTFINNAFFCCDGLMVYGDGDGRFFNYLAGALDVVAHEMSHGVTEFSSSLVYEDEPGALNEAFSDIMGASIEYFYQPVGSGPEKADWLIAEDAVIGFPGYLRSLNNPNAVGDPDHYSLRRFIGTDIDNGGVHFNLTIATHAFYLAVAGGRNRVSGQTVTGVGMNNLERMERIFYRGWVFLMGPNSKFTDARAATLQAATDLYGSGSNERNQVAAAWSAVGVN